jgi:hypothetical protein
MNMVLSVPADFRVGPESSRAELELHDGFRESFQVFFLRELAGTASLNGLHLSLAEGQAAETGRQLGAVEELAILGADGAQGVAGLATNAAVEGRATERTVLLSLGAVGSEGVGKSSDRRGGVDARSVVDGLCRIGG